VIRSVLMRVLWGGLLGLGMLQIGCGGSKPARFYLLTTIPPTEAAPAPVPGKLLGIGIGPVRFPDYLRRTQIVTFNTSNQVALAEFDRWAEPLDVSFTRVLAENLVRLIPTEKVFVYPWKHATPIDYQVALRIARFEMGHDGRVWLQVRWGILAGEGDRLLSIRSSSFSHTVNGEGYDAIAAAMSAEIADLSREIADTIRTLAAGKEQEN